MSSLGVPGGRSRSSSNASTSNPSLSARHNPQPAVDFTIRVGELRKQYIGRNGTGDSVSYVPVNELRIYWTDVKVRELSQAYTPHLTFNYEAVSQIYLRVFSILVYTDKVQFFDALQAKVSDEQLPMVQGNLPQYLKSPVFEDVLKEICRHQWIFCPLILDYARLTNLELESEHILPFHEVEEITEGDAAHIFKIKIHASCNRLHPKDKFRGTLPRGEPPPDGVYVLKSYRGERYRRLFLNESKALTTLHQKSGNEHIVGYYGSYIQNGNFNLLLQFANAGSLLDYYRDPAIHPPKDPSDTRQFWNSLVGVFKGLHQVHQIKPKRDELGEFRGIHEDIKPDNILLNKATTTKSVYDFTPLLTDFGHSHFRVPTEEDDEMGVDRQGNQTYGAPEVSRHARYLVNLPGQIPTAADIWSMGCVMSDAAAWVVFGPGGREEYRKLREEFGRENKSFEDPGHFDCFHDATERSEVVDKMHARIRESCHPEDAVTPKLLDLIENHMLVKDRKNRWTAKEVHESSNKIIQKSEGKKTIKEIATTVQTNIGSLAKQMLTESSGPFRDKKGEAKGHSQADIVSTPDPGLEHHGVESKLTSILPSRPKIKNLFLRKDRGKEPAAKPGSDAGATGTSTPTVVDPDDEHNHQTPPIKLSASPNLPPRPNPGLYDPSDMPLARLSDEFSPSGESHVPGPFSPTSETGSLLSPPMDPDHGGSYGSRPPSPALSVRSATDLIRDVDVNDLVKSDLNLDEAKKWRRDWKGWRQLYPDQHRTIRELQHTLKGRDHIFFIDDSRTMKKHAPDIEEALETLAYIVKPRDGSGSVSLAIGSTTASPANGRRPRALYTHSSQTTKLVDILREKCSYERIETVIEDVLSDFVDKEIIPRLPLENGHRDSHSTEAGGRSSGNLLQRSASASRMRLSSHSTSNANPISLIVFTNGQWGDGKRGAGVDAAIKRLTNQLKERELKRTQVMIQFLRFGDDENGIRNLEYLAGLGRDSSDEYKGYSIVDTQPIAGSLCSMLIGSISNSHVTNPVLRNTKHETPL